MKRIFVTALVLFASSQLSAQSSNAAKAKEIVGKMTLEQKAELVVGNGFHMPGMKSQGPTIGETQDKVPGAAGTTHGFPDLKIPSIVLSDGPAGVRISPYRNGD